MKRLLTSTAALSIALAPMHSWPAQAQTLNDRGAVVAEDGTILCKPTKKKPCALEDFLPGAVVTQEDPAAAVDSDTVTEDPAAAAVEEAPLDEATIDEATKAARKAKREARKAAAAAKLAEEEAAAKAAAEGAVQAQPDAPLVTEPVPIVVDQDTTQTAEPVVEPVAEPAPEPVAEPVATPKKKRKKPAPVDKTPEELAAEAAALQEAQKELVTNSSGEIVDPAAGLKTKVITVDPDAAPVEAPVISDSEAATLTDTLAEPETIDTTTLEAVTLAKPRKKKGSSNEAVAEPVPVTEIPVSPDAVDSVITVLTEDETRTSSQEFAPAPVEVAPGQKNRLSDLEKVGLFALGALAIGAIIKGANDREDRQVVSNTGDRVVVLNPDGSYSVYKDDDTVLRRPGSTVRTETFKDGSTRTIVERADGSQVVTIRDATGRVLRRAAYDRLGREIVLFDDLAEETPVVVSQLPKPKADRSTISLKDRNAVLKARLAALEAGKAGRKFSLRQIRQIPEVRALAATIDAGTMTFDSGSAAIKTGQADALADLGTLMQDLLAENPAEVFLIEGHTDAVGKAAMNLALSDRRAESVALALTEYFDIPPENMVVQGYGESELLIDTEADERRNRRVAVRVITPLLRTAAN